MDLQTVIAANKAAQKCARELNTRAGETLFPVMSREEITAFLAERLGGARCVAEVKNPSALAFPPLPAEVVDHVLGENPDTITLCGETLPVEYRAAYYSTVYPPRVRLSPEAVQAHVWKGLPDEGVRLPGGRTVEVVVPFGYDAISGQEIPELKSRCVARANKSLWDNWPQDGRPTIGLPDPADPATVVPEMIECQYGVSVVDDSPLVAFGAVGLKGYRYYSSDPWFEGKWFQSREEAEAARTKSVAKLEEIRKEAIEQKRVEQARTAAEEARDPLRHVQSREGWYDLDASLRRCADDHYHAYRSSFGADDMETWTAEARRMITEVEAAFAERARLKAERVAAFAPLLQMHGVNGDVGLAERIDAFVRDCTAHRGARRAAEILRNEAGEAYGRGRRTDALCAHFRDVEHRGLDWASGRDICQAAEWAEYLAEQEIVKPKKTVPPVTATPASGDAVAASLVALQAKFGGGKQNNRRR